LGGSDFTVQDVAALGVRRVSVGGARSPWAAYMRTAQMIAHEGRFDGFKDAVSDAELDALNSPKSQSAFRRSGWRAVAGSSG